MTSEQIVAVQRKFYAMAGMKNGLCEEGIERVLSGFRRYGPENHRKLTDTEWRQETREELQDSFVMLTGLEASRHGGGDPLGMVVGVVLKHLEGGFSATFVEDMVKVLGELAAQDGRDMPTGAFGTSFEQRSNLKPPAGS